MAGARAAALAGKREFGHRRGGAESDRGGTGTKSSAGKRFLGAADRRGIGPGILAPPARPARGVAENSAKRTKGTIMVRVTFSLSRIGTVSPLLPAPPSAG